MSAASTTTAEEWIKVADAVERRKIQNRNAQRKYRTNLRKRVEELERNGAFIAFANGSKSQSSLSSREVSQLMSEQNMQTLNNMLSSREAQNPVQLRSMNSSPKLSYLTPPLESENGPMKAESSRSPRSVTSGDRSSYFGAQDHEFLDFDTRTLPSMSAGGLWGGVPNMPFPGSSSDESMGFSAHMFPADSALSENDDTAMTTASSTTPTTTSPASDMCEDSLHLSKTRQSSVSTASTELSAHRRNSLSADPCRRRTSSNGESDIRGRTPLHLAAARGYPQIVRLLIHRGIDMDLKDDQGWTALHLAVEGGHQSTVQVLLDAGACLHSKG